MSTKEEQIRKIIISIVRSDRPNKAVMIQKINQYANIDIDKGLKVANFFHKPAPLGAVEK